MKRIFEHKNFIFLREEHFIEHDRKKLEKLGANVISYPVIKTMGINREQLVEVKRNIKKYDIIILTSIMGVRFFFQDDLGINLEDVEFACIGKKTAEELEKYGYKAKYIPDKYSGEHLAELLLKEEKSKNILIARSNLGRKDLYDSLSKKFEVDEIHTYKTVLDDRKRELDFNLTGAYVIFSSGSTFRFFREKINKDAFLKKNYLVSIGPITSNAIKEAGFTPYVEASEYTIDGIIEKLKNNV